MPRETNAAKRERAIETCRRLNVALRSRRVLFGPCESVPLGYLRSVVRPDNGLPRLNKVDACTL